MKKLCIAVVVLPLLATASLADPNEGPIPLFKAFADKAVSVNVTSASGYSKVFLKIRNLECGRRSLRLPGTYLRPSNPRYQRLALGYAMATRSGDIAIEEGQTWEGWVTSCCMDSGLGTPGNNTTMIICGEKAPDDISRIMEEWAAHPGKAQSEVNNRVWGVGRPQASPPPKVPRFLSDDIQLMTFGDRILVRFRSGDLLRLRDDGKWQVLAIGAGKVGVGPGGIMARFGPSAVRAYNETARAWSDVPPLASLDDLFPSSAGALAIAGGDLFRLHNGSWRVIRRQVTGACPGFETSNPSVYAVTRGRKLVQGGNSSSDWKISARSDYSAVLPTSTTLYAMDSRGIVALKRDGESRILFCSPRSQVQAWQCGLFVRKPGEDAVLEYREGQGWDRHCLPQNTRVVAADPVSGRLCALLLDGKIVALSDGGKWADLGRLPHKDPDAVTEGMLFEPEGGLPEQTPPPVTDRTERG